MGDKNNLEIERRFLVSPEFSPMQIPVEFVKSRFLIHQIYLCSEKGISERIRRTVCEGDGSVAYTHTKKSSTGNPMVKIEKERTIDSDEFAMFRRGSLSDHESIEKIRTCFWHNGQKFELDYFLAPVRIKGLMILELEMKSPNQKIEFPYYIPIACEITGVLSNAQLAKRPL